MTSEKISIIAPAYNLGGYIGKNISEICNSLDSRKLNYELIVVDDGSSDNTYEEAKKFNSEKVKVLRHKHNEGKGDALKYGFAHSTGSLVTFLDADLDLHPEQIDTFLDYFRKNGADIVIGSKRHRNSKVSYPATRRFLSNSYSIFIKLLFNLNISDTQVGFKLFKREVLEKVLPKVLVKKYAFDLELLVNASRCNYKIVEAPVTLNYQKLGSYVSLMAIWHIFVDTLAIAYRLYILHYYNGD